jgi:hypothetical protein
MVTHRNRIGRSAAFKSDLTSKHGREKIPFRELSQQIVASGVLYYCRLSIYNHGAKITKTHQKTPVAYNKLSHSHLPHHYPSFLTDNDEIIC